jgi:hypothetical protein
MSSAQFHLEIFFVLSINLINYLLGVRWVYFEVFLLLVGFEVVRLETFGCVQRLFHVSVELLREIISVVNSENSLIEIDICGDIEILP